MICSYEDIEHKAIAKEAHNGDHRVHGGVHLIAEVINSAVAHVTAGRGCCQVSSFIHVFLGMSARCLQYIDTYIYKRLVNFYQTISNRKY